MAGDRHDNLLIKFSSLIVDSSSLSPDPLGSKRPAQAGVIELYTPKKWLCYCYWLA